MSRHVYVIFSSKLDDYARSYDNDKIVAFISEGAAEQAMEDNQAVMNGKLVSIVGIERDSKVIKISI